MLRKGALEALDRDNLAEEIDTLGRSERREIESRLNVLLLHMLKWKYQPAKRKAGWKASIVEARRQIGRTILESPSLSGYPEEVLADEYEVARLKAADETGLDEAVFPPRCPFSVSELLDPNYLPLD